MQLMCELTDNSWYTINNGNPTKINEAEHDDSIHDFSRNLLLL